MEDKSSNLHKGHREKTRKRFIVSGFNGAAEHNVLELLLFYGITLKDTNPIAHKLINEFGSLANVFNASEDELFSVSGMTRDSALLISSILPIQKRFSDIINLHGGQLNTSKEIVKYMASNYDLTSPKIYALCFNYNHSLIACLHLGDEEFENACILKELVSTALQIKSASVVLFHTHPHALAVPSNEDLAKTKTICDFLHRVYIDVENHIIVSGDKFYSMKNSKHFEKIFASKDN